MRPGFRKAMTDEAREELIATLRREGIGNKRVLAAMEAVDRRRFVPGHLAAHAYEDRPLPIGCEQTISQPFIVAYMAQALDLKPDEIVLECGTGCGYNAAVLSKLVKRVYSLEIVEELAESARRNLEAAGIGNVEIRQGDGFQGWPEKAPFDAIALTAAPATIPRKPKEQLAAGGRLIAPVGVRTQNLVLLEKINEAQFRESTLLAVRFVPMTGRPE